MTLGQRLKNLRKELHLSQEEIGGQGFVSAPGWIKIENSQRLPSDRLIAEIVRWLVKSRHLASTSADRLREELLTLKYLSHRSEFVRGLAGTHHEANFAGEAASVGATSEAGSGSGAGGSGRAKSKGSSKPAAASGRRRTGK